MVARTRPQIGQRCPVLFGGRGGFGNDDSGASGTCCVGRPHTCSYSRTGRSLAGIVRSCRGAPCGFSKDLNGPCINGGSFFVVSSVELACRLRGIFLVGSLSIFCSYIGKGYDSDYFTSYFRKQYRCFLRLPNRISELVIPKGCPVMLARLV